MAVVAQSIGIPSPARSPAMFPYRVRAPGSSQAVWETARQRGVVDRQLAVAKVDTKGVEAWQEAAVLPCPAAPGHTASHSTLVVPLVPAVVVVVLRFPLFCSSNPYLFLLLLTRGSV